MLGLIFHYTGRLYTCIAVHAFHNILMLGLGGLLIARPDLALILFTFGAWLIAATFSHIVFVGSRRRLATIIILPLSVLLIHGGYRWLHMELWLWGAKRHLMRFHRIYSYHVSQIQPEPASSINGVLITLRQSDGSPKAL